MKTRFQILRRWAAYRLGLRDRKGLRYFHLSLSRDGDSIWAFDENEFLYLLASTRPDPGHWPGAIAPEYYEGKVSLEEHPWSGGKGRGFHQLIVGKPGSGMGFLNAPTITKNKARDPHSKNE